MVGKRCRRRCAKWRASALRFSAAKFTRFATWWEHLTEEHQSAVRCKMRNAYGMREYVDAKRALDALLHQLMHLNPSAVRSLGEGMEETLTVHRLRAPNKLRTHLANTNIIESAFSTVETICRNVKRWQGSDQLLRWVASGLLWAESPWSKILACG